MSQENNTIKKINSLKFFFIYLTLYSFYLVIEYYWHRTSLYNSSIPLCVEAIVFVLFMYGVNPFVIIVAAILEIIQNFSMQIINVNPIIELVFLVIKTSFYVMLTYSLFRHKEKLVWFYSKKTETVISIILCVLILVTTIYTIIGLMQARGLLKLKWKI